jgi:DHA2 family multidrug resistance protein
MSGPSSGAAGAPPSQLTGAKLAITALALALGTFMQVLDSTIANVSLPTICGDLGVSTENGTWVITAFAATNGIMVPLTGWLMARFGIVRVFSVAVVAFTVASILCGIAWDLPSLVVFRIIQGGVSGPLIPGSQALLIAVFPPNRRATALTIWSMTTMSAPVLGPVLGGYISDNYYWGWIFLINIPFGIAAAGISWINLKNRETPTRKMPIDIGGLVLLGFWVFSLQSMLDLGKDRDWFNNPMIVILAIGAALGFVAWLIWELTEGRPAVDLSLFRNRNFAIGSGVLALGYALLFANNVLMPLWLQTQMGYTATWAGLVSAPTGLISVMVAPLVGRLKWDPRITATIAFAAFCLDFFIRSHYPPDASFWTLALPLFIQGVAFAALFVPLLNILLDGIPPEKVPSASGLSNFARIIAGSFAASIVTTYWDRREALHQSRLVDSATETAPIYHQALDQLQSLGMSPLQAVGSVMQQVETQAYLLSSLDIFHFSSLAALGAMLTVWFARRPKPARGPAPVAAD